MESTTSDGVQRPGKRTNHTRESDDIQEALISLQKAQKILLNLNERSLGKRNDIDKETGFDSRWLEVQDWESREDLSDKIRQISKYYLEIQRENQELAGKLRQANLKTSQLEAHNDTLLQQIAELKRMTRKRRAHSPELTSTGLLSSQFTDLGNRERGNQDDTVLSVSSTPDSSPLKNGSQRLNLVTSKAFKTINESGDKLEKLIHQDDDYGVYKEENKENLGHVTISDSEPEFDDISDLNIFTSPEVKVEVVKHEKDIDDDDGDVEFFDTSSQLKSSQKMLDLTTNPFKHRQWYPEDFKINPITNFNQDHAFSHRKLDVRSVHPAIQEQFKYAQKVNEEQIMKRFNELSGGANLLQGKPMMIWQSDKDFRTETTIVKRTPEVAFNNPNIHQKYKVNIMSDTSIPGIKSSHINDNDNNSFKTPKFKQVYADPNNSILPTIKSRTIKLWDRPDSPPGYSRSDFPNTQERESDRALANEQTRLKTLRRLFQAVYVVDGDKQVGKFVFKNQDLNLAVCENKFHIDETIFQE